MTVSVLHPPQQLTLEEVRQYYINYHYLLFPRTLTGKKGIMDYFLKIGCIQYDPLNIVGRNADLVLQSRIKDYQPEMLEQLLYDDRILMDGWDKVMSIYPITDYPYFNLYRQTRRKYYQQKIPELLNLIPEIKTKIEDYGPLSSLDLDITGKVDWSWSPVKISKALLESMFFMGELIIHSRKNTRRIYDLTEKHLPSELTNNNQPLTGLDEYRKWRVLRRMGSMGLVNPKAPEFWLGIHQTTGDDKKKVFKHLLDENKIIPVHVKEIPNKTYYIREIDQNYLDHCPAFKTKKAAIIGALDNFIWDRNLINDIFQFKYSWEVYIPAAKRKYGYYVLPILYGDQFIARFEPQFDKKQKVFTIANWWWEAEVKLDDEMEEALIEAFQNFTKYLKADSIGLSKICQKKPHLNWISLI
ncbi:MAG: winged helix DNA-binding domain-containing protein [Spirochaetes bacterium]|nr:winged helix DNA-binding domain-containing protein [Spirochaetota bacterium]